MTDRRRLERGGPHEQRRIRPARSHQVSMGLVLSLIVVGTSLSPFVVAVPLLLALVEVTASYPFVHVVALRAWRVLQLVGAGALGLGAGLAGVDPTVTVNGAVGVGAAGHALPHVTIGIRLERRQLADLERRLNDWWTTGDERGRWV